MGERMARWGREYIDPKSETEPVDRNGRSLGVKVFRAYSCEFGMHALVKNRKLEKPQLTLTVDLCAKILRTKNLLDSIHNGKNPNNNLSPSQQNQARRAWQNEVVICVYDKRCYSVIDLVFDKSPASLPVQGLNMNHAEYFEKKKGMKLKYPNAKPLVAVLGRNKSTIYLPAELVCGNELEPKIKQKLPSIASFEPEDRNKAIEEINRYLIPGAQKNQGSRWWIITCSWSDPSREAIDSSSPEHASSYDYGCWSQSPRENGWNVGTFHLPCELQGESKICSEPQCCCCLSQRSPRNLFRSV
jgi:hypothetical protein